MSSDLQVNNKAVQLENVLVRGDLSTLSEEQSVSYYLKVCESIGLNPLTKPFEYMVLNGKKVLYAKRDATDQLRQIKRVSVAIVARERQGDVFSVTARATLPDGRQDESIGAVYIGMAKGDALANLLMKAETKAKRRVTLSICGLGLLDETEVETISHPQDFKENKKALPARNVVVETKKTEDPKLEEERQKLYDLVEEKKMTPESVIKIIRERYLRKKSSKELSVEELQDLTKFLSEAMPFEV